MKYAFDIDGTLCTSSPEGYDLAQPFESRIKHVNRLFDEGHSVLLFSARGQNSGRDLREFTEAQLRSWEINYTKLLLSKPSFDLLVDDKAVFSEDYWNKQRTAD